MLKHLLFETPFMVFADVMVAVWIVLLVIFRRIPIAFFTVVLVVDLVLFVVGIASFVLEPSDAPSRDDLLGPPAAVVSIANFATGLTCCALLAGLTVLGDAITRRIRNRQQDARVRPRA